MGLYDDKLNPTYEIVSVAFLPIKSVKIKCVIIKGVKKRRQKKAPKKSPRTKNCTWASVNREIMFQGRKKQNHRWYAIAVLINILLILQKIVTKKRKNIDKWRLFYGLCDPTRPDSTRCDLTRCDLNNHGGRRRC